MSSPAPFRSVPSQPRAEWPNELPPLANGDPKAPYELHNLGTELRNTAAQMKAFSYLVLRVPTEEAWAYAQPAGVDLTEAPPPYPLWIPRREAVVDLALKLGLEMQCVAEDTIAFHNWTSRFFPSITLTLAPTQRTLSSVNPPWSDVPVRWLGKLSSTLRHLFVGEKRSCFVFQKVSLQTGGRLRES